MRGIGSAHSVLFRVRRQVGLESLCDGVVDRWIDQVLRETQPSGPRRQGPLSPRTVLWMTLAMALWRDQSIPNVFRQLLDPLRQRHRDLPLDPVSDGALAHARKRLGSEPLKRCFELGAADAGSPATFHGLRVHAVDGVHANLPDTPANVEAFGRPATPGEGDPLPQVLLVALSCVRTHEIRALRILPCRTDERRAAASMFDLLGPGDLALMDRGLHAAWMVRELQQRKISFVIRLPKSVQVQTLTTRGPGDEWVRIRTRYQREGAHGRKEGPVETIEIEARMVTYRVKGETDVVRLLVDVPADVSTLECAHLYHERWEIELGNDEVKTHLTAVKHGTLHTPFRGRSPELVEQEIWATFTVYNLIRRRMKQAAQRADLDPRRISLVDTLGVLRRDGSRPRTTGKGQAQRRHTRLLEDIAQCHLTRWRRPRRASRAVRRPVSRYRAKTTGERCEVFRVTILLGRAA